MRQCLELICATTTPVRAGDKTMDLKSFESSKKSCVSKLHHCRRQRAMDWKHRRKSDGEKIHVHDAKQLFMCQFVDLSVQSDMKLKPFKLVCSMLLIKMKETSDAVAAVPAYLADFQRRATEDTGPTEGLDVLRMISDQTAAPIAYGVEKKVTANELCRSTIWVTTVLRFTR